jgi:hypothetical protein
MFKKVLAAAIAVSAMSVQALDAPIVGNVESKCVVTLDKQGVYGNPSASVLVLMLLMEVLSLLYVTM